MKQQIGKKLSAEEQEKTPSRHLRNWVIVGVYGEEVGEITWSEGNRQYAFRANKHAIFCQEEANDIAKFLGEINKEFKQEAIKL